MSPSEYIQDLFDENDKIALVLIPRTGSARTQQRIWTAGKAASEKVQGWLRHANAQGADIYVSMNPLHPTARRRLKENVAEVRRVYLDLDQQGRDRLKKLLKDGFEGKIPPPSYLVNTSQDRYQVIWNVKPGELSVQEAESLMRGLVTEYGGDPAATDVSRVLRLPGFKHRGRDSWVTASSASRVATRRKDWPERLFRLGDREAPKPAPDKRPVRREGGGDRSPSGRDWARTRDGLRSGEDRAAIEDEIRAKRQDKHNPADYARRTVERAARSLEMER